MDLGDDADRDQSGVSIDRASWFRRREGMAHWRWILFAAMARFEVEEDRYLRLPNARVIRHGVATTIPGAREGAGEGHESNRQDAPATMQERRRRATPALRFVLRRIMPPFRKA
jgi:hypothetical protein